MDGSASATWHTSRKCCEHSLSRRSTRYLGSWPAERHQRAYHPRGTACRDTAAAVVCHVAPPFPPCGFPVDCLLSMLPLLSAVLLCCCSAVATPRALVRLLHVPIFLCAAALTTRKADQPSLPMLPPEHPQSPTWPPARCDCRPARRARTGGWQASSGMRVRARG